MNTTVSASVLSADFCNLSNEIKKIENAGIEMIHYDVMDGVFVPNISFGIPVLSDIKKCTSLVFDVHLMIIEPSKYIEDFAKAGADIITFHYESNCNIDKTINTIHSCGLKAGISIKPATDIDVIIPYLDKVDMILIMTVEPGFGGQGFMENMLPKIKKLRSIINEKNLNVAIEVDGGINAQTSRKVIQAGADTLVAGSYLFGANDMKKAADSLR